MTARRLAVCLALVLATFNRCICPGAHASAQPPRSRQPPAKPEEPPIYEEQVVVTASKVEQQLVNAPATMTVVTADVIASTPATNYAELFRSVPGVNLSQTSARDFNLTMRSATSTLATSTLALLDGRSLYLDFFGFVAWDLLPVNPERVEADRSDSRPGLGGVGRQRHERRRQLHLEDAARAERQQRDHHVRHLRRRCRRTASSWATARCSASTARTPAP